MASKSPLTDFVCLVTGASRGIGRGIALQLGEAGATVYITGRTLKPRDSDTIGGSLEETAAEIERRGGKCHAVVCDHADDSSIKALFEQIKEEQGGRLDILVNNAYSAVGKIMANLKVPFWEQGVEMWDAVNNVGLRNNYICAVYASQIMVPRGSGLIVNVSSAGGLRYIFNVAYGVGKEAMDRMAADMAIELKTHGVACISLWPGAVRTEEIEGAMNKGQLDGTFQDSNVSAKDVFKEGESTEYAGKAIVALAKDPQLMQMTGRILMTAELGAHYGFKDVDGRQIVSMRCMQAALAAKGHTRLAAVTPSWVKIPYWMFALGGNKF